MTRSARLVTAPANSGEKGMPPTALKCPCCDSAAHLQLFATAGIDVPDEEGGRRELESRLYECTECDMLVRDLDYTEARMVAHFDLVPYTLPELVQRHLKKRARWFQWTADTVIRQVGVSRGSLIDFGCSYGILLDCFAERGWQVAGVEVSTNCQEYLREHRPEYRVETSLDDFEPGAVDVVTAIDSLYYVEDPAAVLRRIFELLRPGGAIWGRVTTRNFHLRVAARLRKCRGACREGVPHLPSSLVGDAKTGFSRKSAGRMLEQCGFERIRMFLTEPGKKRAFKKNVFNRVFQVIEQASSHLLPTAVGLQFLAFKPAGAASTEPEGAAAESSN